MDIFFVALILGLFVGLTSSFLGLGGGILIVPLLPIFAPSFSAREVIATSLCAVFFVVTKNTLRFARKKMVVFRAALILGVVSGVMAFLSAQMTAHLSDSGLKWILAGVLLVVSVRTLLQAWQTNPPFKLFSSFQSIKLFKSSRQNSTVPKEFLMVVVGALTGIISGVTGLGAGVIMSPLLLSFALVQDKQVSPTANGAMIFTSLAGCLGFVLYTPFSWPIWGEIHLNVAVAIMLGAFLTGSLGLKYQEKLSPSVRRWILGSLLFCLTLRVLFSL